VRRALKSVDGVVDIETDPKTQSCTFSAPADLDVEAVLNKFQDEGHKHISGWSKAE
jgi:copper chaperone CopZ